MVPRVLRVFVVLLAVGAGPALAQPAALPSIAKFEVAPSPIGLRGDVRPRQYVGVVGRRAAWLGWETGEAELWVHPIKLASGFSLDFKIPDYEEPIRGADVARTIEVRPEVTTITYSHATFTVKAHILAPLDEPGLLVLLDVATSRPLEINVNFRMVFQYAWPGAFGGQYVSWNDQLKAFLLSESLRQRNAYIGSPWASTASSHPAHALPDAPTVFRIPVDAARARREFIPIAIAGGIGPRDQVTAAYLRLLSGAAALYAQKRDHVDRLRREQTTIDTPDDRLDLALEWAKVNLDEQVVCNPDLGCGLVAGWGPSGQSTRPGFGWFFGGDAAINSLAMSATGMTDAVARGLRFLAKYQRADGKITHEISQAAGRLPWFTDFPYTYYHADTTPYYIVAVWRYWRATGDAAFLGEVWPVVRRAYGWCLTTETDGDGIIENTTGGLGAIEVGAIGERIHQDIYLASVWVAALEALQEMAAARGEAALAGEAKTIWAKATVTLNEEYWIESSGHHAFGILAGRKVNDTLTVWPSTALAFNLLDPARGRRTLEALTTHRLAADWGARMLANDNPLYGPLEYNMGAVWPFVTGFVALGHYNYGRPWAGYPLIQAVARLTFDFARGRHAELLSGDYYRPLDTAVPHQFFATSMLVTPLMNGLLGWQANAPERRAILAPQLPPEWGSAAVHALRVGETEVDVEFEQAPGRLRVAFVATGPNVRVTFAPALPPGARGVTWKLDGARAAPAAVRTPRGSDPSIDVVLGGAAGVTGEPAGQLLPRVIEVTWSGGLTPVAPVRDLLPGESSHTLRILDFGATADGWRLRVEGDAGGQYELRVIGHRPARASGAEILGHANGVTTLRVSLPPADRASSFAEIMLIR